MSDMADMETVSWDSGGRRSRAAGGRQRRREGGDGGGGLSRHAVLPLRLFLGATFIYAGLDKLSSSHYLAGASDPASFVSQTQAIKSASPIGALLDQALANPTPFAMAMAFGELAVGLGALLGLFTRLAALGGALISASLWLTVSWQVHPYYLGNDLAYLLAWTPLLLGGAPDLSLDAVLARRAQRERAGGSPSGAVRRRALIDGGVAAIAVAGTGLLAGSLAARLGRKDDTTATGTSTTTPGTGTGAGTATAPSAGASASGSTGGAGGAAGTGPSVPLSAVTVGGAAKTTDPSTGETVYFLQPQQGQYTALSAVCPHAQCVVNTPKDGKLICPCHGSQFDAATGALLVGPATKGLAKYGVTENGGNLQLGAKQS